MQDGKTALHIAASCGHVKAVEILIEAHIPVNVTDKVLNMFVLLCIMTVATVMVKCNKPNMPNMTNIIINT